MKPKILIMTAYYLPGVKGGGPIQSIKNIVDNLSDKFDFYIITSDRDLGDKKPFDNIKIDKWVSVGNAKVYYTNSSKLTWKRTAQILKSIDYDALYLNSFFSYKFSIVPVLLKKFNKILDKPIILAPRGEFTKGAINLKKGKKKSYITISRLLNFYKDIRWHATNAKESRDIKDNMGENLDVYIANNLTAINKTKKYNKNLPKIPGELKIAFVSRIHPKKNIYQSLQILKEVNGEVEFNIYGPIEDEIYWERCKDIIQNMPNNIRVKYRGIIENENVRKVHSKNHVFLLLTLGENFGHVIFEALIGGSPVIISDRTPWRNLTEKEIGFDIPLEKDDKIIKALNYYVDLNEEEYNRISKKCYKYGLEISNRKTDVKSYFSLFEFKL